MFVCTCMYAVCVTKLFVYMYICKYVHKYVTMYVYLCMQLHLYMYARIYICIIPFGWPIYILTLT